MMRRALILAAAVLAAPMVAEAAAPEQVQRGEALFRRTCAVCHSPGGPGTTVIGRRLGPERALLAERRDLIPGYVQAVVRSGLGSMPWITKVEVPDADLDAIAAYLTRNNPPPESR